MRFEQKTTMKAIIILLFLVLQTTFMFGQTAMTCGGTLNQCGGTYLHPGGSGNYAASANCTQTICSGSAQCVTLQFTAVNLENNFDFLTIYNGSSATGTPLATITGTTNPGNVTSTSGCLTLVFTSDGSVQNSGWTANVICHACGSPPPPPPGPVIASDCSGAVNICTNASFQVDPSGFGTVDELNGSTSNPSTNPGSSNSGCLLSGELNSTWMVVNIASTGTLEFSVGADNGTGCLDWIMFPYNGSTTCTQIVNNSISPVRCNWNGACEGFTGLATPLPTGGDASNFEPELNVTCGQKYLICLSNYSSQSTSLPLNFFGTATISCSTFTPITVNSATICPGQSATLTATGGNTYSWSPATGLSATTGATVTATPSATTTYTVTGTGTCGSGTATSTVTVLPAGDPACSTPTCSATASNTGPYCQGSTIQLNATGGGTYSWSGPNSFTASVQNPSIPSATTTAAGVYTVTINVNGCTATATTTVVVNATPTVSAGSPVSICAGGSTPLNATGGTTYTWSPATGLSSTNTAATTATPASTSTYTVTGTTNGCTATSSVTVTVNTASALTASPVSICAGGSTPISVSGASTYTWSPATGLSGTTGSSLTFNGSASTTYTITGTNAGGCTSTTTVLATVNPLPTITGNNVGVCNSGTVTVNAAGASTYSWSPATNLSSSTGASVTFTAGTTTTYTVTGTNANNCTNTHTITVTVSNGIVVNAGADQQECQGTPVTLTATGGTTYSWTGGVTNGQAFTPAVGTVTYTVTGTDAAGCTGTDQVSVTIDPNPTVNGGVDQSFCAGQSTSLNGSGAATYSWSNGVTNGGTFTPNATMTYTITGTSAAGCTGTDQVIITVNPLPTVFAGNDVTVCDNETVTLTGSGASTYTWTNGASNGIAFIPPAGSTTYTVTGTTAAGCTGTDQVIVTVESAPSVAFAPDVTFGCAPLTVNFTNNSTNGSTCVWQMGNNASPLTGSGTVSYTFMAGGCYDITLTVTSANGCVSSLTSPNLICVEDQPIAAFSPSNSQLTELDAQVHFENGSLNATTYVWDFGDSSPISTAVDADHDYEGADIGTYVVTLIATSPSGCIDTAQSVIQIYEDLIFYIPNTFTPDNDDYNQTFQPIFTSGFDPLDFNMTIYNRWGELIFETNDASIGWDGSYGSGGEITMVQEGVYTWKIEFKVTQNDAHRMIVGHLNLLK